jgi:spoIIIJ-associated protein
MIKIEAETLEAAYQNAASQLKCSVIALQIEVVQVPRKGFLGLFKKTAIIVAVKEVAEENSSQSKRAPKNKVDALKQEAPRERKVKEQKQQKKKEEPRQNKRNKQVSKKKEESQKVINDTIMPTSFVSMQEEDEEEYEVSNYLADYDDEDDDADTKNIMEIASIVRKEINELFELTCFKIESIDVCVYDDNTLLVEFTGEDAALLIGKEGYRYKALSYMLFNWINTKYQVQLRLEIAEFLKNQEDSICKYLVGICDTINKDGRAQTKILDGVLVQIALNELRERYPDKYIVIRSTRDGLKYIIVNDYHSN